MKYKNKFEPGEKVYFINPHNDNNGQSFCELSKEVIESVVIDKNGDIGYWLPSSDSMVDEKNLLKYDGKVLLEYLENKLNFNGEWR